MRNALSSIYLDSDFDVNMGSSIRGREAFIADISEEAMIMFRGLEAGIVVCGTKRKILFLVVQFKGSHYRVAWGCARLNQCL